VTDAPDPAELRDRLLERIRAGTAAPLPDEEFGALALAVFAHQFARNRPYRLFCERRGASPATVKHWTEVPAVPTDAFKAAPLVCADPAGVGTVFRTSGTTAGPERRGEHWLPELALYDAALREGFAAHLLPEGGRMRMLSLIRPPEEVPDSSLSHMVSEVMRELGAEGSAYFVGEAGIDPPGFGAALRRAAADGAPVCILGTSFAFVHWLDAAAESGDRFALPAGSRVMDTGGFKGRSREVAREELYAAVGNRLGIGTEWCVNEYGMTEMSSQFYDAVAGVPGPRLHAGPPWVRSRAVDPETLEPVPDGETGVLRHWDLANLHSVMAVQTADLGFVAPGGIRVLGRAQGAEARGCSLAMDQFISASRGR
jgi:hypothetical protein